MAGALSLSPDTNSLMEPKSILVLKRGPDGAMHVYSAQHQPHTAYIPVPMNIPSNPAYPLTSYGAKQPVDGSHFLSAPSHSYSASSIMHSAAGFSSSLPTSISAPIPIRRHTLPHIAHPEFGRNEGYDHTSPQSYDSSIQSPISVQSPTERSFSDSELEAAGSYAAPVMATPFRGASAVIESGSPYAVHHSRGHAQEGSDGSSAGWRTVAANVIDWSGRAHGGGHSRDSSAGSNTSTATAVGPVGEQSGIPYSMTAQSHSEFPMTPRSMNSGYHEHDYYEHPHIRSFHQASPPAAYYEATQSPNYVLSPTYSLSQYGSFGSPQSISPVALIGSHAPIVPKTESFEPDLTGSYPSNIWQQPRGVLGSLQEDDDKDSSVDDDTKSPSPDSSLPNTPAAGDLALPPVVPSQPFTTDAAGMTSLSPPPHSHVEFDIHITSNGNIRMPRSCRNTIPVPIPNLTKKSRGRRVPTKPTPVPGTGVGKSARTFTCTVDGCGKCFNRGEHLKRHIRSIHTDEKPHVCPVQKCGKTFSRHDNLCQHMRVHGKFSAPADGGLSDFDGR
ncbi:hypothetical protein CTheo_6166 [Ceratobasidium theobromae]|uniref:C2H2-type domain-containing protein n=1 Tax=Ceratobasidium theobromae TaxID=1582974 RepID=A0A5N5QF70_9AGAM|nr:hypothetical protein CTheo_6166 [Ceratobasidium theobromae]